MAANDIRRRWAEYDKAEYELWVEGIRSCDPEVPVKTAVSIKNAKLPNEVLDQICALVTEYEGEMAVSVIADLSAAQGKLRMEPATIPMFTDRDFQQAIRDVPPTGVDPSTGEILGAAEGCTHPRGQVDPETGLIFCMVCDAQLSKEDGDNEH